ncbi:MAG: MCE family protein [Gemmatimonadetes bacterium]|nr:MCE family protein [Gemmatimonadota bacterium]
MRVFAALLVLGLCSLAACSSPPLEVEVAFDTTADLDVGSQVMMEEEPIGEVTGIDWTEGSAEPRIVHVRIEPAHRSHIKTDTRFQIDTRDFRDPVYHVSVKPGNGTEARPGHRFEGRVSLTARLTGAVWRSVDEVLRPEMERVLNDFRRDLDDAAKYGREQWEVLRPELEHRVAELALIAQAEGEEFSENARQEINRLLDRYDQLLDEYGDTAGDDAAGTAAREGEPEPDKTP